MILLHKKGSTIIIFAKRSISKKLLVEIYSTWFGFWFSRITGQENSGSSRPDSGPGSAEKNRLHTRPWITIYHRSTPFPASVLLILLLCFLLSWLASPHSSSPTRTLRLILQLINLTKHTHTHTLLIDCFHKKKIIIPRLKCELTFILAWDDPSMRTELEYDSLS